MNELYEKLKKESIFLEIATNKTRKKTLLTIYEKNLELGRGI